MDNPAGLPSLSPGGSIPIGRWAGVEQDDVALFMRRDVAFFMRRVGFADATVTRSGADGGVDVRASGAVAQVKVGSTATPRSEVQHLHGIASAEGKLGMFFSQAGCTAGAIEWAENRVALFVLESTGTARPVGALAEGLMNPSVPVAVGPDETLGASGLKRQPANGRLRMRADDEEAAYDEVYSELTEAALSSLATVDTPESANAFVTQVAQQTRDLSASVPEFYALEFIDLLRMAVVNMTDSDMADLRQAKDDAVARNEAVAAELNVRMKAARVAGDRAAQHAVWREAPIRRAESQAELDEVTRRARLVGLRLDAFKQVRSSFESAELKRAPVQGEVATTKANPPALKTPQAAASSLPRKRLIRTAGDAEVAAAEFMRTIGFADAKRTPSGADGGIDVIAAGAVAQVKTHMKPIGRPDLQRLCGVAKGRTTLFFSLEGYTPEARKWGDLERMALFRFDYQGEASPINRVAKALMAARPVPRNTPRRWLSDE
jgi:hypothetical protein